LEGHPEQVKKPLVRAKYSGNDVVFDTENDKKENLHTKEDFEKIPKKSETTTGNKSV
jgi:hypothetical protein